VLMASGAVVSIIFAALPEGAGALCSTGFFVPAEVHARLFRELLVFMI
jgi:hypothetical protein